MRTLVTAAASAAVGLAVGLGATTHAAESRPGPVANCGAWHDRAVQQCNLYFPDVRHIRVRLYEQGQFTLGVDYWPGWNRGQGRTEVTR